MSKKNSKTNIISEDKKEYPTLSKTLKIEFPKDKLSTVNTKEDFDSLFAEYSKYFILISNEINELDSILETTRCNLATIQKTYNEKFNEINSDDNFSEIDDGDDSDSSSSDDSSVPPPKKKSEQKTPKDGKNDGEGKKTETVEKKIIVKGKSKESEKEPSKKTGKGKKIEKDSDDESDEEPVKEIAKKSVKKKKKEETDSESDEELVKQPVKKTGKVKKIVDKIEELSSKESKPKKK